MELAVVAKLQKCLSGEDFGSMADEILKAYKDSKKTMTAERKELAKIEKEIANGTKAILSGADYSELNEEIARLKVRKTELEELLAVSPELILTKETIVNKLKQDAQHLQNGDIERLVRSYITKIYAHRDEVIITGGVNISGCE